MARKDALCLPYGTVGNPDSPKDYTMASYICHFPPSASNIICNGFPAEGIGKGGVVMRVNCHRTINVTEQRVSATEFKKMFGD